MLEKAKLLAAASAGLLVLALASLRAEQPSTPEYLQLQTVSGKRGGTLNVPISSDPNSFNRLLTSGVAHIAVAERISADLVHFNRLTFQLEPSLASSWKADPDHRSYTIHLRRGVRFSDGAPFTADDVLFTFQVLKDPRSEALLSSQLLLDGKFPEVTKLDAYTLRITYPKPVGMGLRGLDSIPMLPRHRLLKHYQDGTLSRAWGPATPPENIVGTGPFRLKHYQRGVKIVLERNPYYWKKDAAGQVLPYLDAVNFVVIPDRNSEALRFQTGELDIVSTLLNPENYATLRKKQADGGYVVKDLGPGLTMDFLWFNLNGRSAEPSARPPLDPEKRALFERAEFRRAVSYALDRQGMARSLFLGLGMPQYGPISSGNREWHYEGLERPARNAQRARQLLAQIGLKDGNGDGVLEFGSGRRPLAFTLSISNGNAVWEKMAQVIKQNLKDIGVSVTVQSLLPNEIAARFLQSLDYEAILFRITPTDVVPDLQTDFWYSYGSAHLWRPRQPKPATPWEALMDALTSKLVKSSDPLERRRAAVELQKLWEREMPAIPTIAPHVLVGWNARVGNVRPSIIPPQLLWNAEELTVRAR
jgi:peptide/nickel transport system substrate-binding protein